jgi:hypothetical protein
MGTKYVLIFGAEDTTLSIQMLGCKALITKGTHPNVRAAILWTAKAHRKWVRADSPTSSTLEILPVRELRTRPLFRKKMQGSIILTLRLFLILNFNIAKCSVTQLYKQQPVISLFKGKNLKHFKNTNHDLLFLIFDLQ